jgi:hypothetical protein
MKGQADTASGGYLGVRVAMVLVGRVKSRQAGHAPEPAASDPDIVW